MTHRQLLLAFWYFFQLLLNPSFLSLNYTSLLSYQFWKPIGDYLPVGFHETSRFVEGGNILNI